jgi:2-amino-4-hydroxy-6-hydroxymethyldihydropteridine diphosphokinase
MLLFDEEVRADGKLQLPHPRMLERGFVLRPLAELDPELRHPVTGRTIREELALALARGLERCEPLFAGSELLASEGG